jgi:hypothetical protein
MKSWSGTAERKLVTLGGDPDGQQVLQLRAKETYLNAVQSGWKSILIAFRRAVIGTSP